MSERAGSDEPAGRVDDDGAEVTTEGATDGSVDDSPGGFDHVAVVPDTATMDLRTGADGCYKCSTCDTNCPVAAVDDDFPGPKFQGPEQWRLGQWDGDEDSSTEVDPSVMACSNCMRCDHACPTDVPLSQMHNVARGRYVRDQQSRFSRAYLRNRLLANYGTVARLASTVPRLSNAVLGSRLTRWFNERVLGITSQREFPTFATETFREWWEERGGPQVTSEDRRVAYFHGDYANFNTPEVAKAVVRLYEHFGYEVAVPAQRCSGTPMLANGMLEDAERASRFNVETLRALVEEDYDVICSCTSCSFAIRREYPELFDHDGTGDVAAHTYDAIEYLQIHEDLEGALEGAGSVEFPNLVYHAPCHARNQGLDGQAREVVGAIEGVECHDAGDSCSGISGTYGWKRERYDTSMAIGREMFEEMERADAETGLTECPTCAMQMSHGTGYDVLHPVEVLERALVDSNPA